MNSKRLIIAVVVGLICGIFCFLGGKYLFNLPFNHISLGFILLNRGMIGFVIGISLLKWHWALHGIMIGAVVGSIFAYADFMFGFPGYILLLVLLLNPFFGFVIEFFTTVVFKEVHENT